MKIDKRFIGVIKLVNIKLADEFDYRRELRLFGVVVRKECWIKTDAYLSSSGLCDSIDRKKHCRDYFSDNNYLFVGEDNLVYNKANVIIYNKRFCVPKMFDKCFDSNDLAVDFYNRLHVALREAGNIIEIE